MKEHYHYSVFEYESLAPFERDIIVQMMKENEERKKADQETQKAQLK